MNNNISYPIHDAMTLKQIFKILYNSPMTVSLVIEKLKMINSNIKHNLVFDLVEMLYDCDFATWDIEDGNRKVYSLTNRGKLFFLTEVMKV